VLSVILKNRMKKNIFYIFPLFLILSCNKTKTSNNNFGDGVFENDSLNIENEVSENSSKTDNEEIEFDDSKNFDDLYSLSSYEKLQNDETYKDYISQLIETNIDVRQKFFDAEKTIGKSIDLDDPEPTNASEQKDALWDIGKMAKNMVVDGVKLGVEGYKLNELDNKKKKIYSTFSKDKQSLAQNFENMILKIIDDSYNLPTNSKVGKKSKYKNYRSISKALSTDNEAKEYANSLGNIADDYFEKSFELLEKIKLNQKLGNNISTLPIKNISEEILKNPETNYSSNSTIVADYFDSLKTLSEKLNKKDFKIPVEDWSEERKSNFNFIISDINVKIKGIIESI
jgi:hypothetical protein